MSARRSSWSVVIIGSTIVANYDDHANYSLIYIIFWSCFTYLFARDLTMLCVIEFILCYTAVLYVNYQLQEINDKFILSIKYKSNHMLMKTICEHNSVSKCIIRLNLMYKYVILGVYILLTIIVDLLVYIIDNSLQLSVYFKIMLAIAVINCIVMLVIVNYLWSAIHKKSHQFRPLLHSCLIQIQLSLRQKYLLMKFNERLSGDHIGFTCWQWFPINYYEFYDYCIKFCMSYILIVRFISDL